ncbi:class C beta-lactamase [Xanthobacteraceae bacterium A53D]
MAMWRNRAQWRRMAVVLVATVGIAGTARAETAENKASRVFGPVMQQQDIPGLVVGITRGGAHAFYASGATARTDGHAVTPDTLFELGSISKLFTATLAALAEERGKLSLDDKVSKYLCDDACSIGNNLTLMDLATHRSGGLPLQVPDEVPDAKALVAWLKDWRPPEPGTRSYSNISVGLLGSISAQAMGMDYRQAMANVLFPAFGLDSTFIDVPKAAMARYAFGHDRKTGKPIRVSPGVLDAEAYGVKSSARDMLKVLDVELGRGQASDELRRAVARTQEGQYRTAWFTQDMIWEQYPWPVDLKTMLAGNGADVILKRQAAETISPPLPPQQDVILNKTGSTNGFGGYVAILPGKGLGIVVLANKNYPNEARVAATYALIEALLAE